MGRRAPSVLVVLLLWLVGFGRSDFASDRNECANDLVGLATCLPFVEGQAKTPTTVCCSGLKQVLQKSAKCLCVLVRDRDDPNLGFKINGTSALLLPSTCKSPVNATKCIDLLHLSPDSEAAKIFKQFKGKNQAGNSSAAATAAKSGKTTAGSSSSSEADQKSNSGSSGSRKSWVGLSWDSSTLGLLLKWFLIIIVPLMGITGST